MDNCEHGVDARNHCRDCALTQANEDANAAERKLHDARIGLSTQRAAIAAFLAQLEAADALADAVATRPGAHVESGGEVDRALRAYRAVRVK